ncbi:MAG TPA: tRNA pseudouridine(38-40) synthase TruA [Candidatus Polarisedimenticolia bacterium]|nr:tRNA pseudouridine(38-40) synthase TruA [Candidatus Polarisedimenticolia bacterium]
MPNLRLTIEYVGTAYKGWQIQPAAPTIQGVLQDRLRVVLRHPAQARGAARTDAGVHALGQVASVMTPVAVAPERLARSLDALLPADIGIRSVEIVPDSFHARHSALGRIYRYRISTGSHMSPFQKLYAAHVPRRLDVQAMREAAALLLGRRDFSSFKGSEDVSESPVKEIRRSEVAVDPGADTTLVYTVEASSFLQHMVRNIAGTLIEVGRGRIKPDEIPGILDARDRRAAGPTAPAHGLFLERVLYADLAPRDGRVLAFPF